MLRDISIYGAFLPIVFFFAFFKRNKGGRLWVIPLYAACSYGADWFTRWGQLQTPINNTVIFYSNTIYTFLEGALFVIFVNHVFKTKAFRIINYILSALCLAYGIETVVTTTDFTVDNSNFGFAVIEEASIIILCILYYYEQLNKPEITFVYELKDFWIITAFFSVMVSTLFLLISASLLEVTDYWPISQAATIIKYILLVAGLVRRPVPRMIR